MEEEVKILDKSDIEKAILMIYELEVLSGRMCNDKKILNIFKKFVFDFIEDNGSFLGIYKDNELIGISGWKNDYIMFFYINSKYQRKGYGTILLNNQIKELKKSNYESAYLDAPLESYTFYQKQGFELESVNEKKHYTVHKMKKMIRG